VTILLWALTILTAAYFGRRTYQWHQRRKEQAECYEMIRSVMKQNIQEGEKP